MNETKGDKKENYHFPNRTTITLGDGTVIALCDWVYGSLRSAGVVTPYGNWHGYLKLFASGRSQQLPGAPEGENATFVHTNIPRSGDNGLPKDWEMLVQGWSAQCSLALEQEVIDFASTCSVRFVYNMKQYRDCTLADLLLGGAEMTSRPGEPGLPIHMRENLSYWVELMPESGAAMEKFQTYLRSKSPTSADPTVIAELEQLARLAGGNIGSEIGRIQQKLQPGVRATFWVNLDGYILKTVI